MGREERKAREEMQARASEYRPYAKRNEAFSQWLASLERQGRTFTNPSIPREAFFAGWEARKRAEYEMLRGTP